MMRTACFALAALATLLDPAAHAGECAVASGPARLPLIELYTSEGCSSCPPADRWLSHLVRQGTAASIRAVPLALHVDYWDDIGWKDRFARPEFSLRQRASASLANSSLVYTPQVMLNGKDYRQWRNASHFERDLTALSRDVPPASIQVKVMQDTKIRIVILAQTGQEGPHALYVALYENGLVSTIERGENAGATLRHDAVVRELAGPLALNGKKATSWHHEMHLKKEWDMKSAGIAAFVQNTATGEVLQAVSLPLCD